MHDLHSLGTKGTFLPLTFTGSGLYLHFPGGALLQVIKIINHKSIITVIICKYWIYFVS